MVRVITKRTKYEKNTKHQVKLLNKFSLLANNTILDVKGNRLY